MECQPWRRCQHVCRFFGSCYSQEVVFFQKNLCCWKWGSGRYCKKGGRRLCGPGKLEVCQWCCTCQPFFLQCPAERWGGLSLFPCACQRGGIKGYLEGNGP